MLSHVSTQSRFYSFNAAFCNVCFLFVLSKEMSHVVFFHKLMNVSAYNFGTLVSPYFLRGRSLVCEITEAKARYISLPLVDFKATVQTYYEKTPMTKRK